MKVRIVERIASGMGTSYIIQKKFLWWWYDATIQVPLGGFEWTSCTASFHTLEEAQKFLPLFEGTKPVDRVVQPE